MAKPIVAIITINYNQSKMTIECVQSILKTDYENYRLFVIDNGSTEQQYDLLKRELKKDTDVLRIKKNVGYVGGINFGFKQANQIAPDYYLIMNNDTVIDKSALTELVGTAKKYSQNAIVSGKVYHFDKPHIFQTTGSFFTDKRYLKETYPGKDETDVGQCDYEEERDMLDDIMWLVPRKLYQEIGSYSTYFFLYSEQADYALHAVRKGYKLIYCPKAKIWHKGSLTTGGGDRSTPSVNYWRYKSSVIYLYRNIKRRHFYANVITTLPKITLKTILSYLNLRDSGNKQRYLASLVGYKDGLKWVVYKRPDNGYNPFIK